jgi:RHS repeat-associated protein
MIAVRVSGDPVSGNNGLFYYHTDHLGSTSILTRGSDNSIVAASKARYYPYGGYRTVPTAAQTDRGFTGHRHNNAIGLIYMNARFYVPYINRFASADILVPDPTNPQSFNRYSYVLNNPLLYTDPTGHRPADGCAYEGCTLPNGLNPGTTWQTSDGTLTPWNPVVAEVQDYNPITESVLPATSTMLTLAGGDTIADGLDTASCLTLGQWGCGRSDSTRPPLRTS